MIPSVLIYDDMGSSADLLHEQSCSLAQVKTIIYNIILKSISYSNRAKERQKSLALLCLIVRRNQKVILLSLSLQRIHLVKL